MLYVNNSVHFYITKSTFVITVQSFVLPVKAINKPVMAKTGTTLWQTDTEVLYHNDVKTMFTLDGPDF